MEIIIIIDNGITSRTSRTFVKMENISNNGGTFPTNKIDFNEKVNDIIVEIQTKTNELI